MALEPDTPVLGQGCKHDNIIIARVSSVSKWAVLGPESHFCQGFHQIIN